MKQIFRDITGAPLCMAGSVVCIGAFDGLHQGHRALLQHTAQRAQILGLPAVALTFEPLPREFFIQDQPPPRLTLVRNRVLGFRQLGMHTIGLLRFNAAMAGLSATDFVQQMLVQRLRAKEVWIGPDFHFGNQRQGDVQLLQRLGKQWGFVAESLEPIQCTLGERVSSTRIRDLLRAGEFTTAGTLLGQPYRIAGRVVQGRQLGRTLGFPTANIRFPKTPALSGIYATWVHGVAPRPWPAVSSFGTRPTVQGNEPLLEAHLFDFNDNLYGQHIEVEFVAKLRDEIKFDGLPALVEQMQRDAEQAREQLGAPFTPAHLFSSVSC